MKSKRVGHGHMKWAVCSALLTVSTLAAAAPREPDALSLARISSFALPEAIVAEGVPSTRLHSSLAGLTGRHEVLVRLRGQAVAASGGQVTREQVAAEQAAFINRALALAPSTEVVASVQLALNARGEKTRAYTTLLTVMTRLDAKGLLVRRRQGRLDVYSAALTRDDYLAARAEASVEALVEDFGDLALAHFARHIQGLDAQRLETLRRLAAQGD